jgi:hypothetical protein
MRITSSTMPGRVTTVTRESHTCPGDWIVNSPFPLAGFRWLGDLANYEIRLPDPAPRSLPRLQTTMRELTEWTGWSNRELALAIHSTHPTVDAVLQGHSTLERQPAQAARAFHLHELVSRLRILSQGDRAEITRALRTPSMNGRSALDALEAGNIPGAYLQALDVLRPPRSSGMMQSRFPRRPGEASTALSDA